MLARRLGFLLPLLFPLLLVAGARLGGGWNFRVVVAAFVVLPILDVLLGADPAVVLARQDRSRAWRAYFDGILYLWVLMEAATLMWAASVYPRVTDLLGQVGFVLSLGTITGGIGIVVAHELGHRRGAFDRGLGWLLLVAVCYSHWSIEHNQGHHLRVATAEDPASARAGESFWHFLPRTLGGTLAGAWSLERARRASRGRPTLGVGNRVLRGALASVMLGALVGGLWGPSALVLFLGQAVVAVFLLEAVNYLEHYGLSRRRRADAGYEPVRVGHSWNVNRRLSNWFTFNLQRHSHHHLRVAREYPQLEHCAEAPQLPAGYAGMILVALVPPLWRRLIDPRLMAWQARNPQEML